MNSTIILIGAIISILGTLVTILDRLFNIKDRLTRSPAQSPAAPAPAAQAPARGALMTLSFLPAKEILVIVAAGLFLNYLGLALAVRLRSIVYLDMSGTALTAYLLGPWWGAFVALVSSSLVNNLLYPGGDAGIVVFPWSLVSMTGGIFWGFLARKASFKEFLNAEGISLATHIRFLLFHGLLAAIVLAVPGTFTQAVLQGHTVLALHSKVASAIDTLFLSQYEALKGPLRGLFGAQVGDFLAWALPGYLQNCIRYIPDKTISCAVALVILKYGFPLFEHELIHGRNGTGRPKETWLSPLFLAIAYVPSYAVFLLTSAYKPSQFWWLWTLPWPILLVSILYMWFRGPSSAEVRGARDARSASYQSVAQRVASHPARRFYKRLTFAIQVASAVFVLGMPALVGHFSDFYGVAFNYFCVVYGFMLAVWLGRIAIYQNLVVVLDRGVNPATVLAALPVASSPAQGDGAGGPSTPVPGPVLPLQSPQP